MANMWQVGYWENFVGFADRTDTEFDANNVDARGGKGVEFKRISADQRTVQGRQEPWTDDDGNSYPGTSNTAKLQYGTNYSKQVGDSISVQEGNKSSIQSQGWSNSVMEGISFSTTLGGSFSSTAGSSIGTHLGLKMATFGGVDVAINGSFAMKYNKAGYWEGGTNEKWATWTKTKVVAAEDDRIVARITNMSTVITDTALRLARRSTAIEEAAATLTQRVGTLETDAGAVNQTIGTLTQRVGNVEMRAAQINYISLTQINLSALIINLQ